MTTAQGMWIAGFFCGLSIGMFALSAYAYYVVQELRKGKRS